MNPPENETSAMAPDRQLYAKLQRRLARFARIYNRLKVSGLLGRMGVKL